MGGLASCNHDCENIPSAISFTLALSGQTVSPEVNKVSSSTHSADLWKKEEGNIKQPQLQERFQANTRGTNQCVCIVEKLIFFKLSTGFSLSAGNWLQKPTRFEPRTFWEKGKARPNASLKLTTELDF